MTTTTHVYKAYLLGDTEVELSVKGGRITLDDTQAPHVTGDLTIAAPADDVLELIDRRDNARIRVEAEVTFGEIFPGQYSATAVEDAGVWYATADGEATSNIAFDEVGPYVEEGADEGVFQVIGDRVYAGLADDGRQTRTFDLGVRNRTVPQADGTVRVTLASDEALLQDWAPLEEVSLYDYRSSLRSIVDHVLGQVIPGAALEAEPALDADCTPYWDEQNLCTNPTCAIDATGWNNVERDGGAVTLSAGSGFVAVNTTDTCLNVKVDTVGGYWGAETEFIDVQPRQTYCLRGELRGVVDNSVDLELRLIIGWRDGEGYWISDSTASATASGSEWQTMSVAGIAPVNARYATVGVRSNTPGAVGDLLQATNIKLVEGSGVQDEWWSANDPQTESYWYGWDNDPELYPDLSTSTRRALIERSLDSLTWRTSDNALDYLRPIVQAAGYRLVCDENRKWTLRGQDYNAGGSLRVQYGDNLIDGTDSITADDDAWFDAQVTRYTWRKGSSGDTTTKTDAWALNDPYTKCNVVEIEAPYPGPGRSQYAVTRAQGRGRRIEATVVADWTTKAEQALVAIFRGAPVQVGTISRVEFDLDRDEMTITSRTAEAVDGAIDTLTGYIDDLTGVIDEL